MSKCATCGDEVYGACRSCDHCEGSICLKVDEAIKTPSDHTLCVPCYVKHGDDYEDPDA